MYIESIQLIFCMIRTSTETLLYKLLELKQYFQLLNVFANIL